MKEIHQKILNFVTGYLLECGYPPTNREIADGVGYTSTSTIFNHMRDMREAGLINYIDECPRTITVPGYRYMKVKGMRGHDGGVNNQYGGNGAGTTSRNKVV